MKTKNIFHLPGIKMPVLTHQKIQELTQTPKGKLINGTPFSTFPTLLDSMEKALLAQLAQFDHLKSAGIDSPKGKCSCWRCWKITCISNLHIISNLLNGGNNKSVRLHNVLLP